jgi:hypothetical protein
MNINTLGCVRTLPSHGRGHRFNPCRAHHKSIVTSSAYDDALVGCACLTQFSMHPACIAPRFCAQCRQVRRGLGPTIGDGERGSEEVGAGR